MDMAQMSYNAAGAEGVHRRLRCLQPQQDGSGSNQQPGRGLGHVVEIIGKKANQVGQEVTVSIALKWPFQELLSNKKVIAMLKKI